MARIVEINVSCNYGSTGHIVEAIGQMAIWKGHEVLSVHGGRYVHPSALPTLPTQSSVMDYVHYMLGGITGKQGRFSTCATKRLVKKLQAWHPDIIHLHNIHGYYLDYEVLFRYLEQAHIPVIWTLHDCWPMTGHCAYYATETGICEHWQTECHHCSKLADYPRIWTDKVQEEYRLKKQLFCAVENLTLVPVSKWMEQNVKRSFLKDKRTLVIHNGIDLDTFYERDERMELRRKWGVKEDTYVLLGVASHWNKRKGFEDILSLADMAGTQLILVGLTAQQKKSLPTGVIGIESTENAEELAELYSLADVFVNPTYSDTFPTTNLEAQACGTPVLTYDTDGSPETLSPESGVVVEKGNRFALREAILRLQKQPLSRMQCAEFACRTYDQDERFKEYLDLYEHILEHPINR